MKGSGGTSQPSQGTARPAPPRTLSVAGRGGRKASRSRRRTGARVLASASLPSTWLPRRCHRRRGWPDAARQQQQQHKAGEAEAGASEEEEARKSAAAAASQLRRRPGGKDAETRRETEGEKEAPPGRGRRRGAPARLLAAGAASPHLPPRLFQVGAPPRGENLAGGDCEVRRAVTKGAIDAQAAAGDGHRLGRPAADSGEPAQKPQTRFLGGGRKRERETERGAREKLRTRRRGREKGAREKKRKKKPREKS